MVEVSKRGTPRLTRSEAILLLIEAKPELADKPFWWWWPRLDAIPDLAPEPSVLSGEEIIGILHRPQPSEPRRDWLLLGGGASAERLAAIVASKVALRRRGREWVGLCPIHNEKTPSFAVYQGRSGKGQYHCQGCGADGDGIDWLRKVEGLSYGEAVKALNGELRLDIENRPVANPEGDRAQALDDSADAIWSGCRAKAEPCEFCRRQGSRYCETTEPRVWAEAPKRSPGLQAYRDRNPDCSLPDWAIDV